jgi:hypothetical protein
MQHTVHTTSFACYSKTCDVRTLEWDKARLTNRANTCIFFRVTCFRFSKSLSECHSAIFNEQEYFEPPRSYYQRHAQITLFNLIIEVGLTLTFDFDFCH